MSSSLIKKVADAELPTQWGKFQMYVFESHFDHKEHVALVKGSLSVQKPALVRIHSECLTGDVFHSCRCDCGSQLQQALVKIAAIGGVLVYLRQEGRGIGLVNKIRAYKLQEGGLDTIDANKKLGFAPDMREYWMAAEILKKLKVKKIRLLTNNPEKIQMLQASGIKVLERIPLEISPNKVNKKYLQTKKVRFGHLLDHV